MKLRGNTVRFASAAVLCGCASAEPKPAGDAAGQKWPEHCHERTEAGEKVAMQFAPSMLELKLHPDSYDGCHVVVLGFMGYFKSVKFFLYLSRDDILIQGDLFSSTFVDLKDSPSQLDLEGIAKFNGKLVLVDGVFSKAAPGTERPGIAKVRRVSLSEKSGAAGRPRP